MLLKGMYVPYLIDKELKMKSFRQIELNFCDISIPSVSLCNIQRCAILHHKNEIFSTSDLTGT